MSKQQNTVNHPNQSGKNPNPMHYMNLALKLAKKGLFTTGENPRVGCVIVKGKQIIGTGYHQRVGEPHAEAFALKQAGLLAKGATAYVTLEPCSHVGKNPSCADALIAAGIKKVVVCNLDPNPLVAGKGIAKLEAVGVKIKQGVKAKKGLKLNRGFFHRMQTGTPLVILKQDVQNHRINYWRMRCQAILSNVDIIDLTLKSLLNKNDGFKTSLPLIIILDASLTIKPKHPILNSKCIIVTSVKPCDDYKKYEIRNIGVHYCDIESNQYYHCESLLKWLGKLGINELFVE